MHAAHADPRRILVAAIAALVLALLAAALVSTLDDLDFSTRNAAVAGQPPASAATRTATPAWVANPVASPLVELQAPAGR
jgi:hypothetical protein